MSPAQQKTAAKAGARVPFAEKYADEIAAIMSKYPVRRSGVMGLLFLAQREASYVTPEMMEEIAQICEMTPAEVLEMVSFYTLYHRDPVGKYVFWVCGTLPCALCGADGLFKYLEQKLGVPVDDITPDGLVTVKRMECLGACSEAPLMLVNEHLETRLTPARVDEIIAQIQAGTYEDEKVKERKAGGRKHPPRVEGKKASAPKPAVKAATPKQEEPKTEAMPKPDTPHATAPEQPAKKADVTKKGASPKTTEPEKSAPTEGPVKKKSPAKKKGAKKSSGKKKKS